MNLYVLVHNIEILLKQVAVSVSSLFNYFEIGLIYIDETNKGKVG